MAEQKQNGVVFSANTLDNTAKAIVTLENFYEGLLTAHMDRLNRLERGREIDLDSSSL